MSSPNLDRDHLERWMNITERRLADVERRRVRPVDSFDDLDDVNVAYDGPSRPPGPPWDPTVIPYRPAPGDVATWSGAKWEAQPASSGGIPGTIYQSAYNELDEDRNTYLEGSALFGAHTSGLWLVHLHAELDVFTNNSVSMVIGDDCQPWMGNADQSNAGDLIAFPHCSVTYTTSPAWGAFARIIHSDSTGVWNVRSVLLLEAEGASPCAPED